MYRWKARVDIFFRKSSFILSVIALLILIGCGRSYYKTDADREVYEIIKDKSEEVDGMPADFTIDRKDKPPFDNSASPSVVVMSLEDALKMVLAESRNYQTQKERLYSQGLSLTLARHEFDPIYSGSLFGDATREDKRNSVSGALSFGISKMLATGADISVAITTNLFRFISGGDPASTATSVLTASVVQPLLKGAGRQIALEELTQAERDMVYAIRDFVRFRKTLSVDIAKSYYDILQQKDQLENAWNNYENLRRELERAKLMAQAGRLPEFQVDQTEQDELSARDRWVRTKESYENLLDEFKIDLAIPTDVAIELDPADMKALSVRGIVPPRISVDKAISVALDNRLDLKNTMAAVDDARRKVDVAANALKPQMDLTASIQADTKGDTKPANFDFDNASYGAGLEIELPLERKSERNAYRQSLIAFDASQRNLAERRDRVKLGVRNAYRSLDQAEKSYDIQQISLNLAEKRVESTTLLQQAGRASTRDVLEAREALLEAQNALSRALVDHFNARLDLFLAMETLRVNDNGLWIEEDDITSEESGA